MAEVRMMMMMLVMLTLMRIVMMTLMIQAREGEADEDRDARRARNQAHMAEVRMMMMIVMMLVMLTLMRIVMMTLIIQAREGEADEDRDARRAVDRKRHQTVQKIEIGALKNQETCQFCTAFLWPGESSQACCKKGKLYNIMDQRSVMQFMPDPPTEIIDHLKIPAFAHNIRSYNNGLAMASVGSNVPEQSVNFKIQGKLYHSIGALGPPPEGQLPRFGAIYFNDADHETENRLAHQSKKLKPEIFASLQEMLRRVNPYLGSFKAAFEVHGGDDNVKIVLLADAKKKSSNRQVHPGRLSLPQGCEVHKIFMQDLSPVCAGCRNHAW